VTFIPDGFAEEGIPKLRMVVGFGFTANREWVTLIEKQTAHRPGFEWMDGKYNGVGGHVEKYEVSPQAMVREFEEETGIRHERWDQFAKWRTPHSLITFYRAFSDSFYDVQSKTQERVFLLTANPHHWRYKAVKNLPMLVELALNDEYAQCQISS